MAFDIPKISAEVAKTISFGGMKPCKDPEINQEKTTIFSQLKDVLGSIPFSLVFFMVDFAGSIENTAIYAMYSTIKPIATIGPLSKPLNLETKAEIPLPAISPIPTRQPMRPTKRVESFKYFVAPTQDGRIVKMNDS